MKTLKLIFQSLFSNAPIMEAKNQPWYLALIIFMVSILLATFPTYTQINNREGSNFLSGNTYSIENALVLFSETLEEENVDLVVTNRDEADVTIAELDNQGTAWESVFTQTLTAHPTFPFFQYTVNNQVRLRVFYQNENSDEVTGVFANALLALPMGDDNIGSFLLLGNAEVYMYVYNPAALTANTATGEGFTTAFSGTYDAIPTGTNLGNFVLTDVDGNTINTNDLVLYTRVVFDNWLNFFDQSFAYSKSVLLLAQTGLTFVVNAIMALLMSLVIFIMTRGKNNPNKHFKFSDTMKIGAWALLAPALLTIVAGALFPEFAGTAFVLFVGLRLMWLSSRYLRPVDMVATAPAKK
jgi:hypothetical protein